MLKHRINLATSLISFGMIGAVSHFIPLSSFAIVFYRALLASIFIFAVAKFTKSEFRFNIIKKNIVLLTIGAFCMGFNWAFMFLAFQFASVAVGAICNSLIPLVIVVIAFFMFGEKITKKTIFCIILAMVGLFLVADVIHVGAKSREALGVLCGLICAILTGFAVMINKKLADVNSYEKVVYEFILSAIFMIPIIVIDKNSSFIFGYTDNFYFSLGALLFLSLYITGFIYIIYYDAVVALPAKAVAIMTYLEPFTSFVLSGLVLHEKMNFLQIIGAAILLSSTMINEFIHFKK